MDIPGTVNLATFVLMMTRARLRALGDPILTLTPPNLQSIPSEADRIKGYQKFDI